MTEKKYDITPDLITRVRELYSEVDVNGKKVWSQRKLAKELGLPQTYITAFVNGFESRYEYQKHCVKEAGFESPQEYRKYRAKERGFETEYEYLKHLAKEAGFETRTEYRKHLVKEAGFESVYEYRKHLAKERGEQGQFLLKYRLRNNLRENLKQYTREGKTFSSSKYGVDYSAITSYLEKEAEEVHGKSIAQLMGEDYHVDHIIPASNYNLEDQEEVGRCYHPDNLRWLPGEDNMSRGNKFRDEDLEILLSVPNKVYPKIVEMALDIFELITEDYIHKAA